MNYVIFRLEMRLTYFDISESGNCREANSLQTFFLFWKKFVEQDTELFFIWLHAITCTETVDTFSHKKRFASKVLFIFCLLIKLWEYFQISFFYQLSLDDNNFLSLRTFPEARLW